MRDVPAVWLGLLLLCASIALGDEQPDHPEVFIKDGKVWYAPAAHPIFSDAAGKLQPRLSPDRRRVLLADTGSRPGDLGVFHISVIGLDGRSIFNKDVTGTDGPVGSILNSGWAGDGEVFIELELGPSVSEMQIISLKDGIIENTYHGTEFTWDTSSSAVASREYVPMGEPEDKITDSILVNPSYALSPLKKNFWAANRLC
jgi:hypothetical protein